MTGFSPSRAHRANDDDGDGAIVIVGGLFFVQCCLRYDLLAELRLLCRIMRVGEPRRARGEAGETGVSEFE